MANNEGDADADGAYFDELLSTRGEKWLMNKLEQLKAELTTAPKGATSNPDFASFLSAEVSSLKTEAMTLRERLDAALDLLTPEQRTLLRSPKSASAGENPLATLKSNDAPTSGQVAGQAPEPDRAAPPRRFLPRI
jgi:hypothetical protein